MSGRVRRATIAFAVGAFVLLPMSATAAPPGGDTPPPQPPVEKPAKPDPKENPDAPGNPDRSDSSTAGPGGSGDAPGRSRQDPAPVADAPGRSDGAPGSIDPEPGPPSITRAGTVPRSTAPAALQDRLGAAVILLDLGGDESAAVLVVPAQATGLSGTLVTALAPVMPPAFVDALSSPVVVFEALLEAMASSGQALVIPFIAAGIGFFLPGLRRRDIVAAVTD